MRHLPHALVLGAVAVTALAAASCGESPADPPADNLRERDPSKHLERPIDGTPGFSLVFTRTRDDGWRKVELVAGGRRETFHDDADLFMLDANGQGFGTRTVVCGLASPDPTRGASLGILCAVAGADGLGPVRRVFEDESAWLLDVCTDDPTVTVLYSVGAAPFDPSQPADAAPCQALTWSPDGGWAATAVPSATCACGLRDGQACSDPCFLGTGQYRDGTCDLSTLPRACDDHNPDTADYCTGIPGQLCYSNPLDRLAPP